jgi:anti-sigma regulatory factor (Ser/Thr protein kinase)
MSGAGGKGPRHQPTLTLAVPSQTSYLAMISDLTRHMASLAGFDEAVAGRLALAVDEATTNAIEHAYAGAPDQLVQLRFDDRSDELRVEIVDTGVTVDPRNVPNVDLDRYVSERRKGGLGVHLMEKIMDSVTFRRSAGHNICCLVKRKDNGRGAP